jgi:hypothetical protein
MDVTAIGMAAVGCLVGVSGASLALRRDHRETRAQAITEAKETIELLKEQTGLMRQQGETPARASGAGSSRPGTIVRRASRSVSRGSRATTSGSSSL